MFFLHECNSEGIIQIFYEYGLELCCPIYRTMLQYELILTNKYQCSYITIFIDKSILIATIK